MIGQLFQGDARVVLFVKTRGWTDARCRADRTHQATNPRTTTPNTFRKGGAGARHFRTKSNKIVELAGVTSCTAAMSKRRGAREPGGA